MLKLICPLSFDRQPQLLTCSLIQLLCDLQKVRLIGEVPPLSVSEELGSILGNGVRLQLAYKVAASSSQLQPSPKSSLSR